MKTKEILELVVDNLPEAIETLSEGVALVANGVKAVEAAFASPADVTREEVLALIQRSRQQSAEIQSLT